MSKCDVRVDIDGADTVFVAGDRITGRAVVTVDKPVKVKEIVIEQCWATHGRGNPASGVLASVATEGGAWSPGEEYAFPFEFEAPGAPLTYRGAVLNVDHVVRARADVPWALDPKGELDYLVAPGPGSREAHLAFLVSPTQSAQAGGCGKVLGWILLPVLIPLLLMLLAMLIPIGLVAGIVWFVRRKLAEGRVGKVTVDVDAPLFDDTTVNELAKKKGFFAGPMKAVSRIHPGFVVSPGDRIPVRIAFTPRKDAPLNSVTVTLAGKESATRGSGSNRHTFTEEIYEETATLMESGVLTRGEAVELSAVVTVPDTAAHTFKATDNEIEWKLAVRIDLPGSPDWTLDRKLILVPID